MKATLKFTVLILGVFVLFTGATIAERNYRNAQLQDPVLEYPDHVRTIIENKCYGCHSIQGKSEEARDALMWDSLFGLSKVRQVATLDGIIEVLDEGLMPPQRMVEMNPNAALTENEKEALKAWAETTADELLQ